MWERAKTGWKPIKKKWRYIMVIGITGGIGTGKSTVLKLLKDRYFFHIFESDKMGHEVMKPGTKVHDEIVKYFGYEILKPDEFIDREKLGEIVFNNQEKLEYLNSLIHPAVIKEISDRIERIKNIEENANFVVESAILFETGFDSICDKVWYVYADNDTRRKRLKEERGMSDERIEKIINQQLNEEEFKEKADVVLDNSNSFDDTFIMIQKLLVI